MLSLFVLYLDFYFIINFSIITVSEISHKKSETVEGESKLSFFCSKMQYNNEDSIKSNLAERQTRARDFGVFFQGETGRLNSIQDVPEVGVGYYTISESGLRHTGVTAVIPKIKNLTIPCAAATFSLNGNGEMTGTVWIEESGELQTPITITNTHSCGVTRDATIRWLIARGVGTGQDWGLPVAAETYDGDLNDINGFHVTAEHTLAALDGARAGPVAMGSVGGGTGMLTYDFKAGNGSSSRVISIDGMPYTVGVFVQANFGAREQLVVLGVPAGSQLKAPKLRGKRMSHTIWRDTASAPVVHQDCQP
jgi:L-aminopeptidase/D-esterase-like protein